MDRIHCGSIEKLTVIEIESNLIQELLHGDYQELIEKYY